MHAQRGHVSIPLPLILLLVIGAGVWFFVLREKPEEKVDPHAGVKTIAIDPTMADFIQAWNDNDLPKVREFELVDPDYDPEEPDEGPQMDTYLGVHGWDRDGLPKILGRTIAQPQKVRYTVTLTLEGYEQPMVTYWEWSEDERWLIATVKIPKE